MKGRSREMVHTQVRIQVEVENASHMQPNHVTLTGVSWELLISLKEYNRKSDNCCINTHAKEESPLPSAVETKGGRASE